MNSTDGSTEVTATDAAGNVIAATTTTVAINYDRYGPCMTSLTFSGDGNVAVGWYETP